MDNLMSRIEKAEKGDLNEMYNVALYCIWADRTSPIEPEILERAMRYYHVAAEHGDCDAMLDLGGMYASGRGVQQDRDKALKWYLKAADMNYPKAFRCVGNLYYYSRDEKGLLKTTDKGLIEKAYEFFAKGAELGEQNCLYELGDMYLEGVCVDKDPNRAFELYTQCFTVIGNEQLDDSYADVCLRLGKCYHHGLGVPVDLDRALEYLTIAKRECARRVSEGDDFGGLSLNEANEEWLAVNKEIDQRPGAAVHNGARG